MGNAVIVGKYLKDELENIPELKRVRGRGLMIGFDVPEELKDLRKNLLWNQKIFTGEAKPNVIRLLPSLALKKRDAEDFIEALKEEIQVLNSGQRVEVTMTQCYRKHQVASTVAGKQKIKPPILKQFISVHDVPDINALVSKALK